MNFGNGWDLTGRTRRDRTGRDSCEWGRDGRDYFEGRIWGRDRLDTGRRWFLLLGMGRDGTVLFGTGRDGTTRLLFFWDGTGWNIFQDGMKQNGTRREISGRLGTGCNWPVNPSCHLCYPSISPSSPSSLHRPLSLSNHYHSTHFQVMQARRIVIRRKFVIPVTVPMCLNFSTREVWIAREGRISGFCVESWWIVTTDHDCMCGAVVGLKSSVRWSSIGMKRNAACRISFLSIRGFL